VQRCLQRLGPDDAQFVYDAAAAATKDIASHRHGCCVLQRCIDHASPTQRAELVERIAEHALPLAQVGGWVLLSCEWGILLPRSRDWETEACNVTLVGGRWFGCAKQCSERPLQMVATARCCFGRRFGMIEGCAVGV
jgi:hypothetical protein